MYLVKVDNLPRMWRLSTTYAVFPTFCTCVLQCFLATPPACCVRCATIVTQIFAPFTVQCRVRAAFVFTQIGLLFFVRRFLCVCRAVKCACVVCVRFLGKKHCRKQRAYVKSNVRFCGAQSVAVAIAVVFHFGGGVLFQHLFQRFQV